MKSGGTSARLLLALRAARFACVDEAELQTAVERLLGGMGFPYKRELRLSARDRVDFMIDDGIALELKVKTDGAALLRQCLRYAAHDAVKEIVAASTTHHVLNLPDNVAGKPLHRLQLMRW